MKKTSIQKHRFRLLKAYRTTLRILLSFGWLQLIGRFFGEEWLNSKMEDAYLQNARRLKAMILELKGLFIKVGQLISIMSNFLPEAFRGELEGLQDKIPPRLYAEIAARIRAELGEEPENIFKSFNKTPLASASLAQVHEAYLSDGQRVAVKVQYMDIDEIARQDLKTIHRIIKLVEFVLRMKGISANFLQVQEMILEELDFRKEAIHIETIAANFENEAGIKFPGVVHSLSTERILTTIFMEGVKVTNLTYLEESAINREMLANRIITAYCKMIFVDGIYHADPHPGNILIQRDGSVVFIDFGAVAQLSPSMKEGLPQFIEGILKRDRAKITDALRLMGFISYKGDEFEVDTIIDYIYGRFLQELSFDSWSLKDIQVDLETKMEVLGDFNKLNISFRDLMTQFQIPKDWVLLERTVLLLMGLCTHLQPEMNPMKTIKPYLETFVLGQERDWKKFVGAIVKDMAVSLFKMPEEMGRILSKANQGKLEFQVKDIMNGAELIYALGHQILYGLFSMVTGGIAYFSYMQNDVNMTQYLGGASAFFALCVFGSMRRARKLRKKQR